MHATQLLDNYLKTHCQAIHQKRMSALMTLTRALMVGRKLSITGLGRSIRNTTKTKHNIKRADRLIGNSVMNQERHAIHKAMAKWVVGSQQRPVILVDWSGLSDDRAFQLLRAVMVADGRGMTLYEESHLQRYEGSQRVHGRFLKTLKNLLPTGCHPILVTDAGFRTPWFRAVEAMGWDYVGRVGGHTLICTEGDEDWVRVERVFESATQRGRYLGEVELVRKNPLSCHAYLVKKKQQGRVKKTKFGARCYRTQSKENARRERTPWLIVTSINTNIAHTKQVIQLYRTRMQIEEGFRDLKNSRWGFSFNEARCSTTSRYENLLLIAQLANFAIWLIGKVAEMKGWQKHYQANTVKNIKVLSTFFLGIEVIKQEADGFLMKEFTEAIKQLRLQHNQACGYA